MAAHYVEFLSMLVRWLHIVAGIAWIGSSFYFIWLDNSLDAPAPGSDDAKAGVGGDLWSVHGGGFYHNKKYLVSPAKLPEKLHWFMWESYTTWLTGTALLVLVYWHHAGSMMIDPAVATLLPWESVAVGLGSMVGSWLIYDALCKSPLGKHNSWLGLVVFAFLTLEAWALSRTLGGRAAFIHVGTSIGTIMSANVFFVIIPMQRKMVAALKAGQKPNGADGKRGKQRSVHNTYFTLPVLFIMISNHYAATYSHPYNWVILVLLSAAGALIRQFFILHHKGRFAWPYPLAGAILLGVVAWWTAPKPIELPPVDGPVTMDRVREIVGQRCVACHSASPTFPGTAQPPLGVVLTSPELIEQNADRIYQQVIVTRIMPLGNATMMTDLERAEIAAWIKDRQR